MSEGDVAYRRWSEIDSRERWIGQLDTIFFEASLTKTFADEAARGAFRERWFGRFLDADAALAHVAMLAAPQAEPRIVGYLVGALDDPARASRFEDIGYFRQLSAMTARFPAHLHINLAPQARGQGIGRELVERFARDVSAAGLAGFHVVTGAASRNVSFYRRCGLTQTHQFDWNGAPLVLLGRAL